MTRSFAAVGVVLALLLSAPAMAQSAEPTHNLRWDPALDLTLTLGGATAWIVSESLKGSLAPSDCHWCDVDGVDARVREALIWPDTSRAGVLSNVAGFALMPMVAIGSDVLAAAHEGALHNVPEDALLIAEATVVAADVNQLTKLLVGRERPFVHALARDQKALTPQPADNNLSFFSGHTTEAFALVAASGTIATMRGYRWAPLAWSVGGAVAATTAYLRIAADEHWLTDVVVGALVGAGVGFAVPYFFHSVVDTAPPSSASAAVRAKAFPMGAAMTFAW
jgi:membrane-associated phospholipid phosphatase